MALDGYIRSDLEFVLEGAISVLIDGAAIVLIAVELAIPLIILSSRRLAGSTHMDPRQLTMRRPAA